MKGNADMGPILADVHIACMGIEKLIPQRKHLGVFPAFAGPQAQPVSLSPPLIQVILKTGQNQQLHGCAGG